MNHLVNLGVAGFRMDACEFLFAFWEHIKPEDLRIIFGSVKPLSSENGFPQGSRHFFFQQVIEVDVEAIKRQENIVLGTITKFSYSIQLGQLLTACLSMMDNVQEIV
ncbi:hypothetical protein PVAND_007811 [Polypedilum vanderplanki]|uniref:Uncharacterized protein n=1 Tax=Polypedilum vanderplanki TaxID=319348 RepID=A0A9J6C823_POLVA|nr:hypothetical protein PVAND_007811 [Polypedilum vanderplanki]